MAWGGGLLGAPASWVDGEGVCVHGNNADPSQDQLANAGTAVPFPGVGGQSPSQSHTIRWWQRLPVPGLLSWREF